MFLAEAQRIVSAYGDVLAERVATGFVRDINALPFSKTEIKTALQFALKTTPDLGMRGHFRTAYISLADFQELSDSEVRSIQKWSSLANERLTTPDGEHRGVAAVISDIGQSVTAIQAKVAAEAGALAKELEVAGLS